MAITFKLKTDFQPAGDQPKAIAALSEGINAGLAEQVLLGVTGSGKTFTIANVVAEQNRPTLVMAHNKTLAAQLYGEFKELFPENAVEYFVSYYDYYQPEAYVPASDTYIEKDASINEHIEQMRLSATKALLERRDVIIVATVSAIYGLGDPEAYHSMVLHLARGETIKMRTILRRLAEMQYRRNNAVLERGTFRVKGDMVDLFPADSDHAGIRIELFDDEVERIVKFDPLTGEVLDALPRVTIFPKTHYVTPRERLLESIDFIKQEMKERVQEFESLEKYVEAQRIAQRTQFDIEMILELGYCSGIENYSRYLSGRSPGEPPPTLFDYLPADALLVIDESHVTIPQIGGMYRGDRARKENLVMYGFRLLSALDNRPMKFEEFCERQPQTIYVSATPKEYEMERAGQVVEQVVRPTGLVDPIIEVRPVGSQVDDLLSEIKLRIENHERVLVTTLTKKMAEDLTRYYADFGLKVRYLHADIDTVERMELIRQLRLGKFDVLIGINLLREGLDIPEASLVAILDADKEGFLRSTSALIQTMGRAARHVNAKAILYADKITGSMQRAMDETERRRNKQLAYNEQHGIIPQSIIKRVRNILESKQDELSEKSSTVRLESLPLHDKSQLAKIMKQLQKKMRKHAEHLEFEQAAKLRDEINQLRAELLEL